MRTLSGMNMRPLIYSVLGIALLIGAYFLSSQDGSVKEVLQTASIVDVKETLIEVVQQEDDNDIESQDNPEETSKENTDQPDVADEKLNDMVGRMLIVGFRGTSAPENSYAAKLVSEVKPGAVILFDRDLPSGNTFPRNIQSPDQVRNLVSSLKSYADYPLIISVDAEGGAVNRLRSSYGFVQMPSHATLGSGSSQNTYTYAKALAVELKNLGITLNFAPVVDVNINPQSAAIGALGRSFSQNPDTVAAHAEAFVRAHREQGVNTVLKHFPGHGSAAGDTHQGVVDVTNTWQESELIPYRTLISGGYTDPIMTAHVINRTYSSLPATLSKEILTDLLRAELHFTGPIITDDMQMGAIVNTYGLEEAAVRAIEAGADMIIVSNNIRVYDERAPYRVRDAIVKAVQDGRLSESRIRESLRRIQTLN